MSDAREIAARLITHDGAELHQVDSCATCSARRDAAANLIRGLVERACAEARAEEREACAQLAAHAKRCGVPFNYERIAEAIRARAKGEADREG